MTRIIAGMAGGRRLQVPPGSGTRPTSDRVREAVFSLLEARGSLAQARVLDLFAGSGALGLEAASRGAATVTAVELSRRAASIITTNSRRLGLPVRVVARPVLTFLGECVASDRGQLFDLVFCDPPYALSDAELAPVLAGVASVLAPRGLVVLERSARNSGPDWPLGLRLDTARRYGETAVLIASFGMERTLNT